MDQRVCLLGQELQVHVFAQHRTANSTLAQHLAKVATALKAWHYLRFEVREESEIGGEFFRFTPDLGIHRSVIDGLGSIMISEHLIVQTLGKGFDEESLREEFQRLLGESWELALEPFRGVEMEEVMALRAI